MYKKKTVAAVIPAYNEETQIAGVINNMPPLIDFIVVANDASPDKTAEVVRKCAEKDPRVILVDMPVNEGVGGAIAAGYKWARDNDVDMAVVFAGDGQMDPKELPHLLDPVVDEGINYSKANRLATRDFRQKVPFVRFFGNSILSLLTKIASGYWHVADSQTGYTVVDKEVLHRIDWDSMYKRYGQPNDLLIKLNVENFSVRDVPTEPVYNVGEKSGIKISRVIFTISNILLKGFLWRMKEKYIIRDFHPLVLFYLLSFIMFLTGTGFLVRALTILLITGDAPILSSMAMLFSFATAWQALFFAMWFDMEANKHLR